MNYAGIYLPSCSWQFPGVILTMFIIGGMLVFRIKLSLPIALLFGALIAATDPVAVVALFRTLGVPKRLIGADRR